MKIKRVKKPRGHHGAVRLDLRRSFGRHWRLALMAATLIMGLFAGVLTVRGYRGNVPAYVTDLFDSYFKARSGQPFFATLFNSFSSTIFLFFLAFLSGLCALGAPATLLISGFRGLGLGLVTGYLFSAFGLKGVAYSVLLVIPVGFLSCMALVFACSGSLEFSGHLFRTLRHGAPKTVELPAEFRLYCLRYLFLLILLCVAALADATLSAAFIGFFEGKLV